MTTGSPDLHCVPSCDRARGADRAHSQDPWRTHDRRDRQSVSGRREHDGAASGPRQAEDPRQPASRTSFQSATRCRSASRRSWRRSTSSSTRAIRPLRPTSWCATSSAPRRSAWAAFWPRDAGREGSRRGFWRLMILHDARSAGRSGCRWESRPPRRPGSLGVGPRRIEEGARLDARCAELRRIAGRGATGSVRHPGRDRASARAGRDSRGDRLAPDLRAL